MLALDPFSAGTISLAELIDRGDPSDVRAVAGAIRKEQAAKQLSSLRTNDRQQLDTIIMLAARGGDLEMFHVVLRALRRTLTERQVSRWVKEFRSVGLMVRGLELGYRGGCEHLCKHV